MEWIFLNEDTQLREEACATVGYFDGVHRGHLFLVERLRQLAAERGWLSMVVTFDRHPRQVVSTGWQPRLLTTLAEKGRFLEGAGLDRLALLHFDESMARLSARQFMAVLRERLGVRVLLTGYDNRFGHNRLEGFDDYVAYGHELGIDVVQGDVLSVCGGAVSSSRVRRLLDHGEVREAAACLGRFYCVSGEVVHGEQIGRQMGFPTANLQLDDENKLVPRSGVYAVEVGIDGVEELHRGVMNIGMRPTFDGQRRTLEVYLLQYEGDLYGRKLTVGFVDRLRDELHFDSADALRVQMLQDVEEADRIFGAGCAMV